MGDDIPQSDPPPPPAEEPAAIAAPEPADQAEPPEGAPEPAELGALDTPVEAPASTDRTPEATYGVALAIVTLLVFLLVLLAFSRRGGGGGRRVIVPAPPLPTGGAPAPRHEQEVLQAFFRKAGVA